LYAKDVPVMHFPNCVIPVFIGRTNNDKPLFHHGSVVQHFKHSKNLRN